MPIRSAPAISLAGADLHPSSTSQAFEIDLSAGELRPELRDALYQVPAIEVDATMAEDELAGRVAELFGL